MSDTDEPFSPEGDAEWSIIDQHARAVGLLCIYMASLDSVVVRLIEHLSHADKNATACVVGSSPDISQRCEIAKRLAVLRAAGTSWERCVTGILNLISEALAPRRNRYVHDEWYVVENVMVRNDRRPRVKKVKSFETPRLVSERPRVAALTDVHAVTSKAVDAMIHLTMLGLAYKSSREGKSLGEPPRKAIALSNYTFPNENAQGVPAPQLPWLSDPR